MTDLLLATQPVHCELFWVFLHISLPAGSCVTDLLLATQPMCCELFLGFGGCKWLRLQSWIFQPSITAVVCRHGLQSVKFFFGIQPLTTHHLIRALATEPLPLHTVEWNCQAS